jgi:hypothetical protein
MTYPLPKFLDGLDGEEKEVARVRFLIKLCSLHFSPDGLTKTLSAAMGLHPYTLGQCKSISPTLAISLEDAMNDPRFTRELFRPDLFKAAE